MDKESKLNFLSNIAKENLFPILKIQVLKDRPSLVSFHQPVALG